MTKPNRPYDTTPCLDPIIYYHYIRHFLRHLTNFGVLYLTEFLTDFGQILDSKSYDQAKQTL